MAINNHERIRKALELLRDGLAPFVEREFENRYPGQAVEEANQFVRNPSHRTDTPILERDVVGLLMLMWNAWNEVFRQTLGFAERSLVSEIRNFRNDWAHQKKLSGDDTRRALDSVTRLLTAIAASQADEVRKMERELTRLQLDEQVRTEQRRGASASIESQVTGQLKPWREVISPHQDVASGSYQQAEFAADLWQVHIGDGESGYRDPVEFYRRTYLTESLTHMLVGAVRRLTGSGGDPVIQLQTNFGGGKTHSMLALYHLFSGGDANNLAGVEAVLEQAGAKGELPSVKRVVLVGNKISPGNPSVKADGTVVNTLWGELAWQLGGTEAYETIRADDELGTSPGDRLRSLFNDYGPCLILIDEWVAYARQLHDKGTLPAGSFETQFSFAQALTESAKLAERCLLVISLPASDTSDESPHATADDS